MAIRMLVGPRIILRCWLIAVREQVAGGACIHEVLEEPSKGQVMLKVEKSHRPLIQAGTDVRIVCSTPFWLPDPNSTVAVL